MQSRGLSWAPARPLTPHVPASGPCSSNSTTSTSSSSNGPSRLCWSSSSRASAHRVAAHNQGDRPGSSGNGGRPQEPRRSKPDRKARKPGLFEVKVTTPPPRSLGVYALPPLTHNGEEIEIDGHGYVVTSLSIRYKLQKGKYVRDHSRLEVQPTGRYFLNMMLDNLIHAKYMGPTGEQD